MHRAVILAAPIYLRIAELLAVGERAIGETARRIVMSAPAISPPFKGP